METILLVDDDLDYLNLISELLTAKNYKVIQTQNPFEVTKIIFGTKVDLVISDLYMDTITGFQLAELIRANSDDIKIILLTGSVSDQDEVKGLKLSINDYIRKGTSFEIMLQRIENVLSFAPVQTNTNKDLLESAVENIVVDKSKYEVFKNDEKVDISSIEFDLLCYLLENKNHLLSRVDIIKNVWKLEESEIFMDSRAVDTHIKNLRKKLSIQSIVSIRSKGYKWYEEE